MQQQHCQEMDLLQLTERFHSEEKCRAYLEALRWPNGVSCPRCADSRHAHDTMREVYDCYSCGYQFSVTAGTIFHDTKLPLRKWLIAVLIMVFEFAYGVTTLSDYRRVLRSQFNEYSHCLPALTEWNLYYMPRNEKGGTLELNTDPQVIDANAHRIDAHITACLQEFIDMVERVFAEHFENDIAARSKLAALKEEIDVILKRHQKHVCFDVLGAAELKRFEA